MSEKILRVFAQEPINWYSPFYVHSLCQNAFFGSNPLQKEEIIETVVTCVDIYTYRCEKCRVIDQCIHADAVRQHVYNAMENMR
jgi:hypothetical protein